VEAVAGREHALPLRCCAAQLDRRLVRLGAAVAEEDARRERMLDQAFGQVGLRRRVVKIRRVDEPGRLLLERLLEGGMAVTEDVDRDPGDQVQVLLARCVLDAGAVAIGEHDRDALERPHQVGVLVVDDLLALRHRLPPLRDQPPVIMVPTPDSVNSSSSSE
jgi:hypothetical protein